MVRTAAFSLTLFALLLAAPLAQADEAAEARQAYMTASRFFGAEEYEAALPQFQKAYRLSGQRPVTVFGLAQCERALKRYDEAMVHFKEYLATDPANAADVRETIRLLEDLVRVQDEAEAKRAIADAKKKAEEDAQRESDARAAAEAAYRTAGMVPQASEDVPEGDDQERPEMTAELPQVTAPPPGPAQPQLTQMAPAPAEEDKGGVLSSPWFWVITGAVVAGAAVTSGVLLTQRGPGDIYSGSTGVVLEP